MATWALGVDGVPMGVVGLPLEAQKKLASVVRRDGDAGFRAIAQALEAGDAAGVAEAAHRLRGAFGILGIHRVSAILHYMQLCAERDRLTAIPQQVNWARGLYDSGLCAWEAANLRQELQGQVVVPALTPAGSLPALPTPHPRHRLRYRWSPHPSRSPIQSSSRC